MVFGIHFENQIKNKWMHAIIFILCKVFSWIFMIFIWLKLPNANKNDFAVQWLWIVPTLISVFLSSVCHSIQFFGRFIFQVIFNLKKKNISRVCNETIFVFFSLNSDGKEFHFGFGRIYAAWHVYGFNFINRDNGFFVPRIK